MSNNNIIEVNGKSYDADSGILIDKIPVSGEKNATNGQLVHKAKVIDGFIGPPGVHHTKKKPAKQTVVTEPTQSPKPAAVKAGHPHSVAKHALPHEREHSSTLVRSSLKKPALKPTRRAKTPAGILPAREAIKLPQIKHEADKRRLARAKGATKSQFISRFRPQGLGITTVGHSASVALLDHPKVAAKKLSEKPSHPKSNDVLMAGLARATSHTETMPATKRRRKSFAGLIVWLCIVIIIIVAAGFFFYKLPSVNLRIASLKSGVHADMPSYRPGGYVFSEPIRYGSGTVKLIFSSNHSQSYSLTERESNWDSVSLRDEFVAPGGQEYQTTQSDGLTIYTYGSGQGTWVNAGVWYQIGGNANLSQSQIVKIAASL